MLLTSGDWNIDIERDLTFGVFDFMCKKFNSLLDATVEVNQVDLRDEFAYGFCQVDNDGEFLIHIHNDLDQKEYITYSGYPGGQKRRTAKEQLDKRPIAVIESAVRGMLPKTKLGRAMFKKLFVYEGGEHPHAAQKPESLKNI